MGKSEFEMKLEQVIESFALQVVNVIKNATLQELIGLQAADPSRRPGPKPGVIRGRLKPGPKPAGFIVESEEPVVVVRKKRVVKNYPKCAYPGCGNNRFVRGKGYCGAHWRMFVAGEIKSAEEYKG